MKVKDVMSTGIKTVKYSDSVKSFLAKMEEFEISGMPVVDADGRLLGVASMTDVGKGVQDPPLATEADRDFYDDEETRSSLDSAKVADIMTEHVVTIAPDARLTALTDLMSGSGIHRVFVVDGEEVVGVVTSLDLVRAFGEHLHKDEASVV